MSNTPADFTALELAVQCAEPPPLVFLSPTEAQNYQPPEGSQLVGDCHIVKGAVSVIGGAPGVGKSRASVALAVAGALRRSWFDLIVHRRFKTVIVQNENGRFRLKQEFASLDCSALDAFVRICPPPAFGFAFDDPSFRETLRVQIKEFQPDVVVFDPWNAAAQDDKAADYQRAFNAIRAIIPPSDTEPAVVIVAHTRKPKSDEKASGRSLLHTLAGSYVLGSVARSAFVMQPASDDPVDDRVVWTCCKNNDGELGPASAWQRQNGIFIPVEGFDWDEFYSPSEKRRGITEEDMAKLFQGRKMTKKQAVTELMHQAGCKQSAAYLAFKRFASRLEQDENGLLSCKD